MNPRLLTVFFLALCGTLGAQPQTSEAPLANLTRTSHIIFVGRVVKLQASNLKVVAPTETTVLVTVEELLDAPSSLVGLKGEEVTVDLLRADEVKLEQRAVFFTNGILFGEHLEVKEVGLFPVPANLAKFRAEVVTLRAQMANEALKERITGAVLVVTGKVLETRPMKRATRSSEHEPDWAEAVIAVTNVEKGVFSGGKVTVYFPRSTDERWLLSPKFRPNQQGIWILRREGGFGLPSTGFTALHAADYQPLAEQQRIQKLLH